MTFWKSLKLGFGLGLGIALANVIFQLGMFLVGLMLTLPMTPIM